MTTDLRWRDPDDGVVHKVLEREKTVQSGRGSRTVRYWAVGCGNRSFTTGFAPPLVDVPMTCVECIGHVD